MKSVLQKQFRHKPLDSRSIRALTGLLVLLVCVFFFWLGVLLFLCGCKPIVEEAPASTLQEQIAGEVLRLHVIADSNSDVDQQVKLLVKDAVITYLNPYLDEMSTKQDAVCFLSGHLTELTELANSVLTEHGFSYHATATLGKSYFPVKTYGDLTLPAGEYDALRICLGSASGKNWWCLVFPQLCFVDITTCTVPEESCEQLRELLTPEEYALIFPDARLQAAPCQTTPLFDTQPKTKSQKIQKPRFWIWEQLQKLLG